MPLMPKICASPVRWEWQAISASAWHFWHYCVGMQKTHGIYFCPAGAVMFAWETILARTQRWDTKWEQCLTSEQELKVSVADASSLIPSFHGRQGYIWCIPRYKCTLHELVDELGENCWWRNAQPEFRWKRREIILDAWDQIKTDIMEFMYCGYSDRANLLPLWKTLRVGRLEVSVTANTRKEALVNEIVSSSDLQYSSSSFHEPTYVTGLCLCSFSMSSQ